MIYCPCVLTPLFDPTFSEHTVSDQIEGALMQFEKQKNI